MSSPGPGMFVREYVDRVVNRRDLSAVDDMVSPDYEGGGHGWPQTVADLRAFYEWQARTRPDWRIDVQETVEVGDCVVARAYAGGTVTQDDAGRPLDAPATRRVEWLAAYWLRDGRIARIEVLSVVPLTEAP